MVAEVAPHGVKAKGKANRSRAAVASFIVALSGVCFWALWFSWPGSDIVYYVVVEALRIPVWEVGLIAPPVAIALGAKGYRDIARGQGSGKAWAISGIVVGSLDLLAKALIFVALFAAHL